MDEVSWRRFGSLSRFHLLVKLSKTETGPLRQISPPFRLPRGSHFVSRSLSPPSIDCIFISHIFHLIPTSLVTTAPMKPEFYNMLVTSWLDERLLASDSWRYLWNNHGVFLRCRVKVLQPLRKHRQSSTTAQSENILVTLTVPIK
jgi:hypothetical protein